MIEKLLDVYSTPLTVAGRFLFENKIAKIVTIILFAFFLSCTIGITIYAVGTVHEKEQRDYILTSLMPLFASPAAIIALIFLFYLVSKTTDKLDLQLEKLREERVEITQKIENEKELDIFHTIQLSLNQLNEYYTINKGQARSSFRFSIFSIVIGVLTIVGGVWLFYFGYAHIHLAFVAGVSGVLLEFIGGAYFFMYKKSLEQVNFFFGQLIKIQDTMLSINLANNITNEIKKTEMHEKIIISLLERSLK